ncbi:MAG: multidrug ABC transporter permease, partial [Thermosynechococcaceae cyanobacterium]
MGLTLRRVKTFLSVYYAFMVEYRAELMLWVLSNSFPIIMMGVWIEASQTGQFNYPPLDFARYFISVFLVRQFTIVWVIWDFEREVVEGRLSPRLLQPIDPVWHHVAGHLSERVARLPFTLALVVLFFVLYPQAAWVPSLGRVVLAVVAVAIAFALRFLMQYTFA